MSRGRKEHVVVPGDPDPGHALMNWCSIIPVPKWASESTCKQCYHCHDGFKSGQQHNCRLCGEMFCSRCTSKCNLPDKFDLKGKTGLMRVCFGCVIACCRMSQASQGKPLDRVNKTFNVPEWEGMDDFVACNKCARKDKSPHNCRLCGLLYCESCAGKMNIEIPSGFNKKQKSAPHRVCDECRYRLIAGARLRNSFDPPSPIAYAAPPCNSHVPLGLPLGEPFPGTQPPVALAGANTAPLPPLLGSVSCSLASTVSASTMSASTMSASPMSASNGSAANGSASNGSAANGSAANGSAAAIAAEVGGGGALTPLGSSTPRFVSSTSGLSMPLGTAQGSTPRSASGRANFAFPLSLERRQSQSRSLSRSTYSDPLEPAALALAASANAQASASNDGALTQQQLRNQTTSPRITVTEMQAAEPRLGAAYCAINGPAINGPGIDDPAIELAQELASIALSGKQDETYDLDAAAAAAASGEASMQPRTVFIHVKRIGRASPIAVIEIDSDASLDALNDALLLRCPELRTRSLQYIVRGETIGRTLWDAIKMKFCRGEIHLNDNGAMPQPRMLSVAPSKTLQSPLNENNENRQGLQGVAEGKATENKNSVSFGTGGEKIATKIDASGSSVVPSVAERAAAFTRGSPLALDNRSK